MSWWSSAWKRFRAAAGLGAIGAAAGALLGGTWTLVGNLIVFGSVTPANVALAAVVWGTFGAFVATGFAALLAAIGDEIELRRFPLWQASLFGGALGSVFPTVALYLLSGTPMTSFFPAVPSVASLCALLGATGAAGMVAMAKAADGRSLGRRHAEEPQLGEGRASDKVAASWQASE